jgi:hypothetical protein
MAELTRRSILTGTAATAAAVTLSGGDPAAQAAAPAIGKQVTGWYRYKVGTNEVTVRRQQESR